MLTASKCRMYPNQKQESQAVKTFGSCRYIYNLFLVVWNTVYQYTGSGMSYYSCSASLTELKKVLQPIHIRLLWTYPVRLEIVNRYQFTQGNLTGIWTLIEDGRVIQERGIDIDALAPGEAMKLELPVSEEDREQLLNISFRLKKAEPYADAGFEVASEQFVLGTFTAPEPPEKGSFPGLCLRKEGSESKQKF